MVRKSTRRTAKASEKPPETVVRCVCKSQEDIGDTWVQCDGCDCWQHASCVGLADKDIPESYYCEVCHSRSDVSSQVQNSPNKDEEHQTADLLASNEGNEKNNEENNVVSSDSKEAITKESGAELESSEPASTNSNVGMTTRSGRQSPRTPIGSTTPKSSHSPPSTRKRRGSVGTTATHTKRSKNAPKTSPKDASNETADQEKELSLHTSIDEIQNPVRKSVAKAWVSVFEKIIEKAKLEGVQGLEDLNSTSLALQLEHIMFMVLSYTTDHSLTPNNKYREKFRALRFNLVDDKNPAFRARVLKNEISFNDLVNLSSEEMANPDLKNLAEEIRQQSTENTVIKQHLIAPRDRLLDEDKLTQQDELGIAENDDVMFPKPPGELVAPISIAEEEPTIDSKSPTLPEHNPLSEDDTSNGDKAAKRKGSFNDTKPIVNVPSIVEIDDPTILDIVEEEPLARNDSFSSPYSPAEDMAEESEFFGMKEKIWTGKVKMATVSEFHANALNLFGDVSASHLFEILSATALIEGRISVSSVLQYFHALRKTPSKEIIAVLFVPTEQNSQGFDILYDYFVKRNRYGVLHSKSNSVKDAYIIPMPSGNSVPELLDLLPKVDLPKDRNFQYFMGLFVLNKSSSRHESVERATPITTSTNGIASTYQSASGTPTNPVHSYPSLESIINALTPSDMLLIKDVVENNPQIRANPSLAINPQFMQNAISAAQKKASKQ